MALGMGGMGGFGGMGVGTNPQASFYLQQAKIAAQTDKNILDSLGDDSDSSDDGSGDNSYWGSDTISLSGS